MNTAQTVAGIVAKVLQNLPLVTSLAPGALTIIQGAISLFQGLNKNPNATMADIDAAVDKIVAQSAQIQNMK